MIYISIKFVIVSFISRTPPSILVLLGANSKKREKTLPTFIFILIEETPKFQVSFARVNSQRSRMCTSITFFNFNASSLPFVGCVGSRNRVCSTNCSKRGRKKQGQDSELQENFSGISKKNFRID